MIIFYSIFEKACGHLGSHDDEDVDTDGDDNGIDEEAEDVKHTVLPVSWISVAQDWHKWRSIEEGFVKRS